VSLQIFPPVGIRPTPPGAISDPANGLYPDDPSFSTTQTPQKWDPTTHTGPKEVSTPYPPKYNVVDETSKELPEQTNNSAVDVTTTAETNIVESSQEDTNENNNGPLALVTILPAMLIIISILGATLYLVNRKKKAKKRHTKEMVSSTVFLILAMDTKFEIISNFFLRKSLSTCGV